MAIAGDVPQSATVTPGSGYGSFINWQLGTASTPLTNGDMPIVINHYASSNSSPSYGMYITTQGTVMDGSSGFVVENFGNADGSTFAVSWTNNQPNASAVAAFINHHNDVHDQYALSMANAHGRAMIVQSQGTGEALEIRRSGDYSGTTKSGAHIYIDEVRSGNYGHLAALRADANTTVSGTSPQIQLNQGTALKLQINVNGTIGVGGAPTPSVPLSIHNINSSYPAIAITDPTYAFMDLAGGAVTTRLWANNAGLVGAVGNVSSHPFSVFAGTKEMRILTNGNFLLPSPTPPTSSSSSCSQGEISWTTNYVYICTTPNTWKRAALSSW